MCIHGDITTSWLRSHFNVSLFNFIARKAQIHGRISRSSLLATLKVKFTSQVKMAEDNN